PENPFKRDMERTSAAVRVVMCRILVRSLEQEDRVRVSDFELSLPLPSYMINTLTALRREYADHDFKLIIGADNLDDFDKWRESDRIKREFGLIVYPRDNDMAASDTLLAGTSGANPERTSLSECPGYPTERNSDNCFILKDAPRVTVSSTYLRQLARRQSSGDFSSGPDELSLLTSPELAAYIRSEMLYGSTK
ncbi:MAG: hypothetical protein K2I91_03810, partial [Muribaculaceae bacterium]|nr:hypothetical protein [Muribaculaceae bacterium]